MGAAVKICGITRARDVRMVADAGADALGFVLTDAGCRLSDGMAAQLIQTIGGVEGPERIAVVGAVDEARARKVAALGFDGIQAVVTADAVTWMRRWWSAGDRPFLLPVFFDGPDLLARLDAFLADRPRPATAPRSLRGTITVDSARGGGTGIRADWSRSARAALQVPLTLAGGLRADNVAEAIATVRPHAVDVSSGVADGLRKKDPDQVRAFLAASR